MTAAKKPGRPKLFRLGILVSLLSFLVIVFFHPASVGPLQLAEGLPTLSLQGHQRLLVLAPHCDDETLAAAGLIQEALRAGMQVRVVIATNGDGSIPSTMEDFRRLYPRSADFIRMGNLRQQETLAAMQLLGVKPDQVDFLSYPDRGLAQLWNAHWPRTNPYRSPYSRQNKSPYTITFDAGSVYDGEDLLADLSSILDEYRPDLVIYPHPEDYHPDHWALSGFTRLALALEKQKDPTYAPDAFAYLVHRTDFPAPKGLHPGDELYPPSSFHLLNYDWLAFPLSELDLQKKAEAISQYRSQLPLLRQLLDGFLRKNELFSRLDSASLPVMATGQAHNPGTWTDVAGNTIEPVQLDPVRDFITRSLIAPMDLSALYAARDAQDNLQVCVRLRGKAAPELVYTLRILAVGKDGIQHRFARNRLLLQGWDRAVRANNYVCEQVPMGSLGDPSILFLGADVEESGVGILDQIAWQQVDVSPISRP